MSFYCCPNCAAKAMEECPDDDCYVCGSCFSRWVILPRPTPMVWKQGLFERIASDPRAVDSILDIVRSNNIDKGVSL